MNLKGVLVQPKQPIGVTKYECTTGTLVMTFIKNLGRGNPYTQFVCDPHKIC